MNRIRIAIGSLVGLVGLGLAGIASAQANYIELPVDFVSDMLAYVTGLFEDFNLLIVLVIGLPLAFWVIRKTISLVRGR